MARLTYRQSVDNTVSQTCRYCYNVSDIRTHKSFSRCQQFSGGRYSHAEYSIWKCSLYFGLVPNKLVKAGGYVELRESACSTKMDLNGSID